MRGNSQNDKIKRMEFYGICILSVFTIAAGFLTRPSAQERLETVQTAKTSAEQNQEANATPNNPQSTTTNKQVARITASGAMLYHDIVYRAQTLRLGMSKGPLIHTTLLLDIHFLTLLKKSFRASKTPDTTSST